MKKYSPLAHPLGSQEDGATSKDLPYRIANHLDRPHLTLNPKAIAKEAAGYLWNLKEVLARGTIEEQRRFVDYFVQGIRVDGKEGWLEASFYEDPSLPKVSFCMVPPTGFEPVSRT